MVGDLLCFVVAIFLSSPLLPPSHQLPKPKDADYAGKRHLSPAIVNLLTKSAEAAEAAEGE